MQAMIAIIACALHMRRMTETCQQQHFVSTHSIVSEVSSYVLIQQNSLADCCSSRYNGGWHSYG